MDYAYFPLHLSKQLYLANRSSILYLAEKFYSSHGKKEFVHSETGLRTLQDEFDKVAIHNQGHIAQIVAALNRP